MDQIRKRAGWECLSSGIPRRRWGNCGSASGRPPRQDLTLPTRNAARGTAPRSLCRSHSPFTPLALSRPVSLSAFPLLCLSLSLSLSLSFLSLSLSLSLALSWHCALTCCFRAHREALTRVPNKFVANDKSLRVLLVANARVLTSKGKASSLPSQAIEHFLAQSPNS